jgi:hypothetical protein
MTITRSVLDVLGVPALESVLTHRSLTLDGNLLTFPRWVTLGGGCSDPKERMTSATQRERERET